MNRSHRTQTAPQPHQWPEARTAAHCYDWITPETVIRLALAAYYATSRELDHLPDDPDGTDFTFNNGRQGFAEDLAEDFRLRVTAHGEDVRIPVGVFDEDELSTDPRWHWARAQLALRHGPRIDERDTTRPGRKVGPLVRTEPDSIPSVSACPTLAAGQRPDIHRALFCSLIEPVSRLLTNTLELGLHASCCTGSVNIEPNSWRLLWAALPLGCVNRRRRRPAPPIGKPSVACHRSDGSEKSSTSSSDAASVAFDPAGAGRSNGRHK